MMQPRPVVSWRGASHAETRLPILRMTMIRASIRTLCLAALAGLITPLHARAETLNVFASYAQAPAVKAACDTLLRDLAGHQRSLGAPELARGGAGGIDVLVGLDRLAQRTEDTIAPLSLLANVHPSKPLRDAAEACELRLQAFSSQFYQDAKIYARIKSAQPTDAIDVQMQRGLLDSFEDAGVALTPARRQRAQALNNQISKLSQDFDRRVREIATTVAFTEAELDGVPVNVWSKAPRDAQGRRLLGLAYPSVLPVLDNARNPQTRERMWRAFQARGGQANLKLLARLGAQRREYARLFGLASYAEFAVRHRMAQSVERVQGFLGEVKAVVDQREQRDLADLRAAKAADLKQPLQATPLKRWDTGYYVERVKRERFALDQESFRRHFPTEASVDFVFALSGRLFNVGFRPLQQTLWHADAKAYEVFDLGDQRALATLYLDLYPRADKFGHAAVWSVRGSSTLDQRLPIAALVTNFNREGLTLAELETMLHEFGHALHVTLSNTRYATQAGTNVKLDFVEAPSQMLQEWVYDAKVLALFSQVCAACEPVPADLLERATASRSFAKGLLFARQHLYASYDLALYAASAPEPLALWARLEGATPLGYEKGSLFPAAFSHIAGGYSAGYYAYLWSLATAHDLHTAFAADHLNGTTGQRYRSIVLANGGQIDANELVTRFLGRQPGNAAFFEWLDR